MSNSKDVLAALLTAAFNSVGQVATPPLLRAIADDNHQAFQAALSDKPDVNMAGGAPLHIAAFHKNPLMMRLLVTAGADVAYAVKTLENRQSSISRTRVYDNWGDDFTYRYKSKADETRYKELGKAVTTLEKFAKTYRDELAGMETARLQTEMLEELRALRREMHDAFHGTPLDKKKLSAPLQKRTP